MITPECKRGSTFIIGLEATQGDITGASATAVLKFAPNRFAPGDDAPVAAEFAVTAVDHIDPEDTTTGPGFVFVLSDQVTATLRVGPHVMDARIVLAGGEVVLTSTRQINVTERVTV